MPWKNWLQTEYNNNRYNVVYIAGNRRFDGIHVIISDHVRRWDLSFKEQIIKSLFTTRPHNVHATHHPKPTQFFDFSCFNCCSAWESTIIINIINAPRPGYWRSSLSFFIWDRRRLFNREMVVGKGKAFSVPSSVSGGSKQQQKRDNVRDSEQKRGWQDQRLH